MQNITAACCHISIVLQGGLHTQHRYRHIGLNICKTYNVPLLRHWDFSEYETALLWLVFILNIPQPGTHQTVNAYWPHWNFTTVRISHSRPHCLRRFYLARAVTGRKYHYPLCRSSPSLNLPFNVWILKTCKGVRLCGLSVPNSRRNVSDVLILNFQGVNNAINMARNFIPSLWYLQPWRQKTKG